jgi:thioredoxin-like negative regulator of GroEL
LFFKREFDRCKIAERHIQLLAMHHSEARFIRVDVDNAPFLVQKLKLKVLPCIISFYDGVIKDRLEGFTAFGDKDNFKTRTMEKALSKNGVLAANTACGSSSSEEDDDDDF